MAVGMSFFSTAREVVILEPSPRVIMASNGMREVKKDLELSIDLEAPKSLKTLLKWRGAFQLTRDEVQW